MKKKILVSVIVIAALFWAKSYFYDYKINHNLKVISEGKVYKSGVIPPEDIADFVKEHHIKSIIDLRFPGTGDDVNNPEIPVELIAEKEAAAKIKGLNYFNIGSDQVPKPENLDAFFKVMDNQANYPVLIHCFHGVGRAEIEPKRFSHGHRSFYLCLIVCENRRAGRARRCRDMKEGA